MGETSTTEAATRAYAETLRDFSACVAELPDSAWSMATGLPGWTVQDVVSHVIGVESDLLGRIGHPHTPDFGALPHVQDPFAQYVEVAVDLRRSWTPAQVATDLADVLGERILLLEADEAETQGPAAAFFGSTERALVMRPFDVWIHEQDIRRATGRSGNLGGAGAQVTASAIRAMLPLIVGKRVKPGVGGSVRWDVSGEVAFVDTVVVDDDGRAVFADVAEPVVTLTTDWETFALLASGRAGTRHPTVTGDLALANRVLDAMTVTP